MPDCTHEDFAAQVDVNRITGNVEGGALSNIYVEVRVVCLHCGVPLVFHGLPLGINPKHPTMDITAKVVTLPARPANEVEGWGQDGPGFAVTHTVYKEPDSGPN